MSSTIPNETEWVELFIEPGCKRTVIIHCCTVEAVAKEMSSRIAGVDRDLVLAGSLLHDIGRSVDHSILHAYIGSQIVKGHGLSPALVDIVRKHTGAGLDDEDVAEMGLPQADYMPRTLEEKIVAHADNLVSDNKVVTHLHSVEKLRNKGADRGADRIEALHRELSELYGEDLDVLPDRIGQYPDLPLARSFDLV